MGRHFRWPIGSGWLRISRRRRRNRVQGSGFRPEEQRKRTAMANRRIKRRGLTLAELLIAATIMLMIAAAVGTLASAVKSANDYCKGYTTSAQHARVALSRMERAMMNAYANEQFP